MLAPTLTLGHRSRAWLLKKGAHVLDSHISLTFPPPPPARADTAAEAEAFLSTYVNGLTSTDLEGLRNALNTTSDVFGVATNLSDVQSITRVSVGADSGKPSPKNFTDWQA